MSKSLMKFLAIILLAFTISTFGSNTFGQGKTSNGDLKSGKILVIDALKKITQAYGTQFVYDRDQLAGKFTSYKMDDIRGKPLEEVLKAILYPNDFVFLYVKNNYYTIVTRDAVGTDANSPSSNIINNSSAGFETREPMKAESKQSLADGTVSIKGALNNITVKGKVIDETGAPIAGVTVTSKGTGSGTQTDENGRFKITVGYNAILVFSYISFTSEEVAVNGKAVIDVTMRSIAKDLDQVVVIGYGSVKKSDLTGSVGTIKSADLNRNKTTDVLKALQGKIAGVEINSQSGELGSGLNITVRGGSSIYGSSTPLFVIDGIPIDVNTNEAAAASVPSSTTSNPLANINPADIESIEVLKDASATAIYGSRGANGVVLITTKSGIAGSQRIEYDGYVSIGNLSKRIDVLNADQFVEYQTLLNPTGTIVATGPDANGIYTPRNFDTIPKNDWQSEIYKTSVTQSHNLTISGGNKTTTFSGTIAYLLDQGLINQNTNNRYSLRLRVDHQATDKLKVGINVTNSLSVLNGATNSGSNFYGNGVVQSIVYSKPVQVYDPLDDIEAFYVTPAEIIDNAYKNTTLQNLIANINLNYKLSSSLSFNVIAGGATSNSKGQEFYGSNTFQGVKLGGDAFINNIKTYSIINTDQLTYNKVFNKNNSLNIIGAFEINSYDFQSNSIEGQQFADQSTGVQNISKAGVIANYSNNHYRTNRLSYISRVNYNLMNRYLFTGSIRADGSDKFGANNKWAYFPSGAFAWRVSEEPFMKKHNVISNLKVRLSIGATGNERIPAYRYIGTQASTYYSSNGAAIYGSSPDNKANPDLKWESTLQYNAGVDIGLLKERLQINADVYYKKTTNMLLPAPIPAVAGFYTQWQNFGRIDNKGLEVTIISRNIAAKNFNWETNFNISFNRNIVKDLGGTNIIPITVPGEIKNIGAVLVGQPIGTGFGYVFDGVYQLSDFTWQNNSDPTVIPSLRTYIIKPGVLTVASATVAPGSFKYKDLNADGIVDDKDLTVISNSAPKFTGGFTNTFRYNNFDFSVFFQGAYGNQVINQSKFLLNGFQNKTNIAQDFYYNRWTVDNPSNVYGTFAKQNATAQLSSSYYVEDASYLRLKSVTIAYTLPNSALDKFHIKRVRIYATGNNLLTFTKYTGYDPEVAWRDPLLTGVDKLAFPRTRTIIFGANISF